MKTDKTRKISQKTVERLIVIHRVLAGLKDENIGFIYSHELARLCGISAAQVRRDLMTVGHTGSPSKGYNIADLYKIISYMLGFSKKREAVLVGVGHLGRALLGYCNGRNSKLQFTMAFDSNPDRVDRVISGVRCYSVNDMEKMVRENCVKIGVVAVPEEAAQEVVWTLIDAGANAFLNFAPVHLRVPDNVYVENLDLMTILEKVAYFSDLKQSETKF
jgi:redox-sensing transcriptional repressor